MVKRNGIWLSLLILLAVMIAGCAQQQGHIRIYDSQENWKIEDIQITDLEENAGYLGLNQNGFFYYTYKEAQQSDELYFHFRTWSGNDSVIWETTNNYSWNAQMVGDYVVFTANREDYAYIMVMDENGNPRELFRQSSFPLPVVYGTDSYILVVSAEKQETDVARRSLIKVELAAGAKKEIYTTSLTVSNSGKAQGDRIVVAGGNEQEIYFSVDTNGDYMGIADKCTLYKYSIEEEKISGSFCMNSQAEYITGKDNFIVYSQYSATYPLMDSGKIAVLQGNEVKDICTIPLVTCTNGISRTVITENTILFSTPHSAYSYDCKNNKLWVYDFSEQETLPYNMVSKEGFSYFYRQGEDVYLRRVSLKSK